MLVNKYLCNNKRIKTSVYCTEESKTFNCQHFVVKVTPFPSLPSAIPQRPLCFVTLRNFIAVTVTFCGFVVVRFAAGRSVRCLCCYRTSGDSKSSQVYLYCKAASNDVLCRCRWQLNYLDWFEHRFYGQAAE